MSKAPEGAGKRTEVSISVVSNGYAVYSYQHGGPSAIVAVAESMDSLTEWISNNLKDVDKQNDPLA